MVMVCGYGICDVLSYHRPEYNIELTPVVLYSHDGN